MMRDFGSIENTETHVSKDIKVTWGDVDRFKLLKIFGLTLLTGLLIEKVTETAFEAGAEAYDTAFYNTQCELGLITESKEE